MIGHTLKRHGLKWLLISFLCGTTTPSIALAQPVSTELNHKTQSDVLAYVQTYQPPVQHSQTQLSFAAFSDTLKTKRVVFIGEIHDRYDHHLNQLAVIQAMHQQNPALAIGLEWFQQPYQGAINAYLAGQITEAELLKQTGYYERWRYDFRMLRPILEYAKANGLPVVALNVASEITHKIATGGLDQLSPEERAQIPAEINPPSPSYRERLSEAFSMHSRAQDQFQNFALVQRVWDETMAANIVQFLQKNPNYRMAVLAGQGHLSFGSGIPEDVARSIPAEQIVTVHSSASRDIQSAAADYFILSEFRSLPPTGKMGVWLDDRSGKVLIGRLIEQGAAAKVGLQQGDHIVQIEQTPIQSMADLLATLANTSPGDTVRVTIERHEAAQATDPTKVSSRFKVYSVVLQ